MIEKNKILSKFGNNFIVGEATYVMGINHRIIDKIALRFKKYKRVLDACVGAGFISIGIAKYVSEVVSVDVNPEHLKSAEENSRIAKVNAKIKFILGNISSDTVLGSVGNIDAAILDPDWAVGDNKRIHVTKLSQMIPPGDILFEKVYRKTENVALRLPKEIDLKELDSLPTHELEEIYLDGNLKFYMAYFGDLAQKEDTTKLVV